MAKKQNSRRHVHRVTAHIRPAGGIARRGAPSFARGQSARKTLQLCHQIAETLEMVFAEQEDEVLQALHVVSVEPAPDDTNVLVTVMPGPGVSLDELGALIQRLIDATKVLRMEVAASITRKKVPGLNWRIASIS